MESGSKPENYTGSLPSIPKGNGGELAQPVYTESKKGSQALNIAPSKGESSNSAPVVSPSQKLLAQLLAIMVMQKDFQEAKNQMPESRQTSSNGKIYWCVEIPGKILAVENGILLVDGVPAGKLLAGLLAQIEKNTGEE